MNVLHRQSCWNKNGLCEEDKCMCHEDEIAMEIAVEEFNEALRGLLKVVKKTNTTLEDLNKILKEAITKANVQIKQKGSGEVDGAN